MAKGPIRTKQDQGIIYSGCTTPTLAEIFDLTNREVMDRLKGKCEPIGDFNGAPRYAIKDAAPHLVQPLLDVEEFIKSLSPAKLPPALQDQYWKAQNSRLKYELERGDLWRTERVFSVFAETLKEMRQGILMFEDTLEDATGLTSEQREHVRKMTDSLLHNLESRIVENFELYVAPEDEHGADARFPAKPE
jgi:hypothetical protein